MSDMRPYVTLNMTFLDRPLVGELEVVNLVKPGSQDIKKKARIAKCMLALGQVAWQSSQESWNR